MSLMCAPNFRSVYSAVQPAEQRQTERQTNTHTATDQSAKLRNPPLKFGFLKLFQALQMKAENLLESLGFPAVFLGIPGNRKLSNFAP